MLMGRNSNVIETKKYIVIEKSHSCKWHALSQNVPPIEFRKYLRRRQQQTNNIDLILTILKTAFVARS